MEFASEIITNVVTHRLLKHADHQLKSKLDLGFDRSIQSVGSELAKAVARCHDRIEKLTLNELSEKHLIDLEKQYRLEATTSLGNGTWRKIFPGRDIISRFVGKFGQGIPYLKFRDLILARMRDNNFQPPGIKQIVDRIIADD